MSLLFEVVADFKMQAGRAVLEAERVQKALDGISGSADRALGAVANLGVGFAANLGLLSSFGAIASSLRSTEKFQQSVTNIASIITSNLEVFEGNFFDSFNNRIIVSQKLVRELAAESNKLGVQETALLTTFKSIGFIGLQGGLQIEDIKRLATNVQLAAPITGLDPSLVGDQLFRLALQGVSGSPRLFKTLLADTKSFQQFKGPGGVQSFGKMGVQERIQLIAKAFDEFGNRPEIVARQLNSMSSQINIMKNQLTGVESVLRPIGDVIIPTVIESFKEINKLIESRLRPILKSVADIMKNLSDKPIEIFKDLAQLAQLKGNVGFVSSILKIIPKLLFMSLGFSILGSIFGSLNNKIGHIAFGLGKLAGIFQSFVTTILIANPWIKGLTFSLFKSLGALGKVGFVFAALVNVVARLSSVIFILVIFMQTLARAAIQFRINIAEFFSKNSVRIAELGARLQKMLQVLFSPFQGFIEGIGTMLGNSTAVEFFLEMALKVVEGITAIAEGFAMILVRIQALVVGITTIFAQLSQSRQFFNSGNLSAGKDVLANLFDTTLSAMENHLLDSGLFGGTAKHGAQAAIPVVPSVTHTGDVIINNDIKEAFEPDRIAFTITEQIQKALTRPTVAAGNSIRRTGQQIESGF